MGISSTRSAINTLNDTQYVVMGLPHSSPCVFSPEASGFTIFPKRSFPLYNTSGLVERLSLPVEYQAAATGCLDSLRLFLYQGVAFDDGSGVDAKQLGLARAREVRRQHRDELVKRYGTEATQFFERNQLRGGVLGAMAINVDALSRIVSHYGTRSIGIYLEKCAETLRKMTSDSDYDGIKPKGEKHFDEMTIAEKLEVVHSYEDRIAEIFFRIHTGKSKIRMVPAQQRSRMVFSYA